MNGGFSGHFSSIFWSFVLRKSDTDKFSFLSLTAINANNLLSPITIDWIILWEKSTFSVAE